MGHPWFVIDVLFRHKWTKKKGTACTFFPEKKRSKSCLNLAQREGFSLEFVKASIAQWGRYDYNTDWATTRQRRVRWRKPY